MAELRHAVRGLLRSPGFTFPAVATLALGIGAATAIFSVMDGVLLRPLGFHDSGSLVLVQDNFLRLGIERIPATPYEFFDYRAGVTAFDGMAGYTLRSYDLTGGRPERVEAASVTADLFRCSVLSRRSAGSSAALEAVPECLGAGFRSTAVRTP